MRRNKTVMKHQMAHEQKTRAHIPSNAVASSPVLKFRQLVTGILCVVVLIIWPMFMVWKQIYITNVSMRESTLADSLIVLSKQVATLHLYNERLASTQRIESIARTSCGLDYPTSEQIIVVRECKKGVREKSSGSGFLAILRRTFSLERG
jgi:cell division protein FtsL